MQTRFNFDRASANAIVGMLAPGSLMIAVAFLGFESTERLLISLMVGIAGLAVLWLGFTRGTYITIDENKLYGRLFFLRGNVTALSDVISIHQRHTFGGLMAEVYMKYRRKDGTIAERGLVSKQGIKNSEFKNLLEVIRSANPNIRIDPDLLDK
jgi:hypothetical protein